jgi:hypothetical protein
VVGERSDEKERKSAESGLAEKEREKYEKNEWRNDVRPKNALVLSSQRRIVYIVVVVVVMDAYE